MSRREAGDLFRRVGQIGELLTSIGERQRTAWRRLFELDALERPTRHDQREGDELLKVLLDGERAGDIVRTWWNEQLPALEALVERFGGELDSGPFVLTPEVIALRHAIRGQQRVRARELTWSRTLRRKMLGATARVLIRAGRAGQRWFGDEPVKR